MPDSAAPPIDRLSRRRLLTHAILPLLAGTTATARADAW